MVQLSVRDVSGVERGTGSGFFVSPDGVIVTNHHVIDGARELRARLTDGRELEIVGVIGTDAEHDLALVKVDGEALPALELGSAAGLREGDRVAVIGSPLGLAGSISEGIFSASRDVMMGRAGPWLQITAAISPGSSGSPVLDAEGRVVGVAVATMLGGQSVNVAAPARFVAELLAGGGDAQAPEPLGSEGLPGLNLLLSLAFFAAIWAGAWWTRRRRRGRR